MIQSVNFCKAIPYLSSARLCLISVFCVTVSYVCLRQDCVLCNGYLSETLLYVCPQHNCVLCPSSARLYLISVFCMTVSFVCLLCKTISTKNNNNYLHPPKFLKTLLGLNLHLFTCMVKICTQCFLVHFAGRKCIMCSRQHPPFEY